MSPYHLPSWVCPIERRRDPQYPYLDNLPRFRPRFDGFDGDLSDHQDQAAVATQRVRRPGLPAPSRLRGPSAGRRSQHNDCIRVMQEIDFPVFPRNDILKFIDCMN